MNDDVFIHPRALIESDHIGSGTRCWANTHVLAGARIGSNCNLCDGVYVESEVRIGDHVTIKNGVSVWDGITLEDGVFVGPSVVFTNELRPRSRTEPRGTVSASTSFDEGCWSRTRVREGATLGAGAVILCDLEIGPHAFIAAGSVVTRSVPAHGMIRGNPGRLVGFVCECAAALDFVEGRACCGDCGREFDRSGEKVHPR
ncbi:MAG: acyltransferase [Planctomycetota bacterium]|jgi:acetyltransferase-like isoleucine patch superfamily enzyme|nr:acyltransferase [Planctomycetota bacterium]